MCHAGKSRVLEALCQEPGTETKFKLHQCRHPSSPLLLGLRGRTDPCDQKSVSVSALSSMEREQRAFLLRARCAQGSVAWRAPPSRDLFSQEGLLRGLIGCQVWGWLGRDQVDMSIWCSRWTGQLRLVQTQGCQEWVSQKEARKEAWKRCSDSSSSLFFPPPSEFPPKVQWRGFLKAGIHDLQQWGRQNWKL